MTKKILKGVVKSAKNNKTIVVEVTRKFKHPFYEKVTGISVDLGNAILDEYQGKIYLKAVISE